MALKIYGGTASPTSIAAVGGLLTDDFFLSDTDSRQYSSTSTFVLGSVPAACLVTQALVASSSGGVSADNTNYWTFDLTRWRAGVASTIASKTTKSTGGEAIVSITAWTFDSVVWDTAAATLVADDVIGFVVTKSGTATALNQLCYTVRTEPL